MELVDGIELLAGTHELDGLVHHRADGEGRTATGVTVELGQYHAVEVQAVVEFLGRVHGILTGHGIDHEEDFVGMDGLLDGGNLVHHFLVHGQTTGGIDDNQVVTFGLGLLDGVLGNLHGVFAVGLAVHGHVNLLGQYAQLFDGGRTIDVAGHEQRLAVLLRLEHAGQLAREGCLTRTLQTRHQDDRRFAAQVDFGGFAAHQLRQFVVDNLHHQLAGLDGGQHVLSHGLCLDGISKVFGHLVVDVGVEQGFAYVLQGFGYIDFGDFAFTFQYLERPFEPFA